MPPKTNDDFVPLICPQCGGHIKITQEQYKESFTIAADGKSIMYIGVSPATDGGKCQSCGTEFARKAKLQPDGKDAMKVAMIFENGGTGVVISIEGNHEGNITVGDHNVVNPKN